MPWDTPTLKIVRGLVRDNVRASLPGADASVPNSVLRVLGDAQGGLCHLTLQYIDWLALQLLPDTDEVEWLDRHATIWLVNADGSRGRKQATFASGSVTFTGDFGTVVPTGTQLTGLVGYETTSDATIGVGPSGATARALDPGVVGNMNTGDTMSMASTVPGADGSATVVAMTGGVDTERDNDLRERVLARIRQPPMGGDANDYVQWALQVPGVTRAWSSTEMGIGTVTVRFMMDELRAVQGGFPTGDDILTVQAYINMKRPVAIKDFFIEAPVPEPIDFMITGMIDDTDSVRAAVEVSVADMLRIRAAPAHCVDGQMVPGTTIYAAWVSATISNVVGVESFTLQMDDHPMPYNGSLAVLGTVLYER